MQPMRFVEIKTPDQQAILALHRTRDLVVRQRTQTINMLRAQLAEFGIVFPRGVGHATQFAKRLFEGESPDLPDIAGDVIVYIKAKGQWMYLYRAIDKCRKTFDFILSRPRDKAAARRFFRRAIAVNGRYQKC